MFIDTHAHLSFPEFDGDLPQVVERAEAAGVDRIVSIATSLASARRTLAIAERFPGVVAAVGLHPTDATPSALADVRELGGLAGNPNVVAIGETGLDYYRLNPEAPTQRRPPGIEYPTQRRPPGIEYPTPRRSPEVEDREQKQSLAIEHLQQRQKDLFWAHLGLAKDRNLPVVIHNRAADRDLLEIVRAHAEALPKDRRPWGVMHCFSGDAKYAFDCIEIGLLISYTGILTFRNAASLREVARNVSLDHVMLETDAPYLAPVPHRGKRNEPAHVPVIAAVLAEIKGRTVAEVAAATSENARRLFRMA